MYGDKEKDEGEKTTNHNENENSQVNGKARHVEE